MTVSTHGGAAPPPERFNFAAHLIKRNAARAEKVAYIDDQGSLTYGELADRARRFATALVALGVRHNERVLLLMHDCNDWPVAFLGALYSGAVPVAVDTQPMQFRQAFLTHVARQLTWYFAMYPRSEQRLVEPVF